MIYSIVAVVFVVFMANVYEGKIFKPVKKRKPEVTRKLIHITNYLVVAVAPLFISYPVIILLESFFLVCTVIARKFRLFESLNLIGRVTWGDQLGAIGVIIVALFQPNQWVFMLAMVILGLADAAAALVGIKYGRHIYYVFGHKKSIEGSLTFFIVATMVMMIFFVVSPGGIILPVWTLLAVPLLTTFTEAVTPLGLDNLAVPLVVVGLLGV
jgi:phytol kinase